VLHVSVSGGVRFVAKLLLELAARGEVGVPCLRVPDNRAKLCDVCRDPLVMAFLEHEACELAHALVD